MTELQDIIKKTGDKQKLLEFLQAHMTEQRAQRFEEVLAFRTRFVTVAVEDVYQERNASAIVRTADCFGIQDVHIIENYNSYQLSKEIARGAEKWVDIHIHDRGKNNSRLCIDHLRKSGYRIAALTPHRFEVTSLDYDLRSPTAFFLGGEKEGLSETVLSNADDFIRIPMFGFTESYNISVAAALLLMDITRKLHGTTSDWHLSEDEKLDLRLLWTMKTVASSRKLIRKFLDRQPGINQDGNTR